MEVYTKDNWHVFTMTTNDNIEYYCVGRITVKGYIFATVDKQKAVEMCDYYAMILPD